MRRNDPNIAMLELAARGLGPLTDEVVFLGGCATGLLITDAAAPPTRETKDVDVIVEISTRHDYHVLSGKLRDRGFCEERSEGAPICRWIYQSVVVDVMPTDGSILGFSNRWYSDAMHTAERIKLPGGVEIRIVTAPFFLATKLEAFYGRGKGDFMASHDLEDMIAMLDGKTDIVQEVSEYVELRAYLSREFAKLLENDEFQDALPGHLPADAASQARIGMILDRMQEISGISDEYTLGRDE